MKKLVLFAAALAAASTLMAQTTNQVLSRNAVGYVAVDVPAAAFRLVTMPFNMVDGAPLAVSNVLATVSNGTQCILWDQAGQVYVTVNRNKGSWGTGGTNRLPRGTAFFLAGAPADAQTVYLMGEVPDTFSATQTVTTLIPGFNMNAYGYPVSTLWTNTQISQSLVNGDQFIVWDGSNYQTYNKNKGSWGATANAYVLRPGEGFFAYKSTSTTNVWTEVKPYTWP